MPEEALTAVLAVDTWATADQLRDHAFRLKWIGREYGYRQLRVDQDGTLVGNLARPGYRSLLLYRAAVLRELGLRVRAVSDDSEVARSEAEPL